MNKLKTILKPIIFIIILVLVMAGLQAGLTNRHSVVESNYSSIKNLPKDEVQVLIFGTSHVYKGVSPERIYEQYGITALDISNPGESADIAYIYLKEALANKNPELVILDSSSLFYKPNVGNHRFSLDSLPFSLNKVEMAKEYSRYEDKDERLLSFAHGMFPLYYYHNRWKEIGTEELTPYYHSKFDYSKGYATMVVRSGKSITVDEMNAYKERINNELDKDYYNISDIQLKYFNKFIDLCESKDIPVLITALPVVLDPRGDNSAWTYPKYEYMKEFCAKRNLPYLDMLYDNDLGIDYYNEYSDDEHANYQGMKKITDFLASYLVANYDLEPRQSEIYSADLETYNEINRVAELETIYNFEDYMTELAKSVGRSTIYVMGKGDITRGLTDNDKKLLAELGVGDLIDSEIEDMSYVAVSDAGENAFEKVQYKRITTTYKPEGGAEATIVGSGWSARPTTSCLIGGVEYSVNGNGINIVVYDNESKTVVDSVSFSPETRAFAHSDSVASFFNDYRDYVLGK